MARRPGVGAVPGVHPEDEAAGAFEPADAGLPAGFDVLAWTRAACAASGVPFAVEDPVVLGRLRTLTEHPA
jgi:hypothetical protein